MEEDYVDIIYLNFSSAFDMIFHNRLQVKMKSLVISKNSRYYKICNR